MTRPTDTHKEFRSYTVFEQNGRFFVKPSHWAVGYTPAYRATPEEAIEYEIEKLTGESIKIDRHLDKLRDLQDSLE